MPDGMALGFILISLYLAKERKETLAPGKSWQLFLQNPELQNTHFIAGTDSTACLSVILFPTQ